ncbi:Pikachurin [Temnothorax longispinosus]|uniref:Pikachurin n=1 Tax=Temnothorax longispinosus TaxID=300112 RepID=A0A4S2JB47_9HYME|nr:Pikachurin [Temnothorax longispinosus]
MRIWEWDADINDDTIRILVGNVPEKMAGMAGTAHVCNVPLICHDYHGMSMSPPSKAEVRSPRFTGSGWLAFPALRAAYKHVQLELEFRPEAWDGVLLLAGERDDLQGDFMALILHHGFIEFRYLNFILYGLFSRITFREPLFVGGPGNTTGLERLPVRTGFKGCIRHLEANEHHYRFPLAPQGDAANGFDIDRNGVLFPQVPSFNGSSYLRYPGLADTSLSWLELSVTLKPTAPDGVILYNGHHSDATGDFIALYLSSGHVQFTFDLGTGPATLR